MIKKFQFKNIRGHWLLGIGHSSPGMSVMEIIVVVAISSIMLVAFIRFVAVGYPISKITYLQVNSTETARLLLKRMAREMRQLRYSDTGGFPLKQAGNAMVQFYANVDGDPATERVRYEFFKNGTILVRGITKPSGSPLTYNPATETVTTVATNIRNGNFIPVFVYYSGNYPADTVPLSGSRLTLIKYIQFHLIIDADPNQPPAAVDVSSQVQLRNVKTNLGE